MVGCDSSESYDCSWHLSDLINEMQKDMKVKVLRSNSLYKRLVRKIEILAYSPIRLKKENIRVAYNSIRILNNARNIYIPTNEDNFFGEEAIKLGFKNYFKYFKNRYTFEKPKQNIIAVHLRRNNIDPSNLFYVSDEWYLTKLYRFNDSKYEFVMFTDSIDIKDLSNFLQFKFLTFGREVDPLESIVRLSTYNILILSKSTFSFWAAALSEAEIIISPFENELGQLHRPFNLKY